MIPGFPRAIVKKAALEYPIIIGALPYSGTAQISTHNVPISPSQSGDLLLLALVTAGTGSGAAVTTPTGWSVMGNTSGANRLYMFQKVADGTEGVSVPVTLGAARRLAAVTYCIRDVYEGVHSNMHPTSLNPPSVTAPWGKKPNLFIVIGGGQGYNPVPSIAPPDGYSGLIYANTGQGSSNNPLIAGAFAEKNSASDDPVTWNHSATVVGRSATFVIR